MQSYSYKKAYKLKMLTNPFHAPLLLKNTPAICYLNSRTFTKFKMHFIALFLKDSLRPIHTQICTSVECHLNRPASLCGIFKNLTERSIFLSPRTSVVRNKYPAQHHLLRAREEAPKYLQPCLPIAPMENKIHCVRAPRVTHCVAAGAGIYTQ